ncbi:MAG: sensor histidine kinase [Algoriphagus sp.]|uniref:sensor histidine kinase n=1 Tax=Algoriphagus sp. TaxID=1872435 RepID=UPI00261EFA44|nr:sensor histidine kinase [Algoriphagus sp.]MDG1276209.1 sensor histidine kinase [Algoriphagus sp.]
MPTVIQQKKIQAISGLWTSFPKFIGINFMIAVILIPVYCPSCLLSWEGLISAREDFIFAFLFSSVLSFGGSRVDDYYEARISWISQPIKRLILTVITYLIYCFIATFLIAFFISWFYGHFTLADVRWDYLVQFTKQPMIIAFVFMSLFTTRSWLLEWKKSATEAEKLRTEMMASQYQSLKDQLNPHFLFNSLNVLSNLVYEDADRSAAFILKLSKIYRYVLEVQQEELVALEKELDFAKNYLELQKIRFEENLIYNIKATGTEPLFLPPLSLQLLLENAIKHNEASQENPLFIQIIREGNELWISNTFQPKKNLNEPSTGIGLANIRKRYELLSNQEIQVIQTADEFIVKLPLLKLST